MVETVRLTKYVDMEQTLQEDFDNMNVKFSNGVQPTGTTLIIFSSSKLGDVV